MGASRPDRDGIERCQLPQGQNSSFFACGVKLGTKPQGLDESLAAEIIEPGTVARGIEQPIDNWGIGMPADRA